MVERQHRDAVAEAPCALRTEVARDDNVDPIPLYVNGVLHGVLEKCRNIVHGITCGAGMPYKLAEIAAAPAVATVAAEEMDRALAWQAWALSDAEREYGTSSA